MKVIRHNVFETNSSATHSITINKHTCVYDTLEPYNDGVLLIRGQTFDRWYGDIQTVIEKCKYVATCMFTTYTSWDAISKLQQFERVVKEHTGATEIVYESVIDQYYVEDYDKQLEKYSDGDLKDLLFNPNSIIKIYDRDQDDYYPY
jgi:hypothetical protein